MKKTAAFVLASVVILFFLVDPGFAALPRYEITDLGTLGSDAEYAMLKFQGTHTQPLRVPADYQTIQAAIDAAVDGDTVLVAEGTYTGEGNRDIDFLGKAITVRSENGPESCIIDCNGTGTEPHRGFNFHSGEDANSIIDGFTVTNGFAPKEYQGQWQPGLPGLEPLQIAFGGAIYCRNSSPTIRNCHLYNNTAELGGAVFCRGANSVISNCTIRENLAYREGGGFGLQGGTTKLVNCGIIANRATFNGGGISCFGGYPEIMNCTITVNSTDRFRFGGGICIGGPGECVITNSILWGNRAAYLGSEIALFWGYSKPIVSISYSDIRGGLPKISKGRAGVGVVWDSGNIDAQPCFFDSNNGDYHLLPDSPCIDTGDPNYIAEPNETDLDGRPRVMGGRIDMGAYESPIPAKASIVPRTVNLASEGKWINCYISLPEDYDVADIDPNSVLLEDQIEAESLWVDEREQIAMARFNRSEVQGILDVGEVELTITGQLSDGTVFEGTDVIRVIDKGSGKPTN